MRKKTTLDRILLSNRKCVLLVIVSLIILSVLAPLKSFIMQWLIDSQSKKEVLLNLLLGIGVVLASHFFEYISRNTFNSINTQTISTVRETLTDKLKCMPLRRYMTEDIDTWQASLTNDLKIISEDYLGGLFNMAMWGGMGLVAVIYMAVISPILLIVTLFLSALPFLGPKLLAPQLSETKGKYAKSYNQYCAKVSEFLRGYESLLLNKSSSYFQKGLSTASSENVTGDFEMKHALTISQIVTSLIAWIPGFVVLVVGAFLVIDGTISIGYLVTANSLVNFIISPFRQVANAYISIKASKNIKKGMNELLKCDVVDDSHESITEIESVRISNLAFSYNDGDRDVIRNINIDISKGSKVAIVGTSGSGKSTILKLLGKYYSTYRGSIQINGVELNEIGDNAYFEKVAYISQEPFVFNDSIRNNICLGNSYAEEQLVTAIETAGLSDLIENLPAGLDTVMTEQGGNISGGQKKRIAIARALIRGCDTLLIDEVTSSLDIETTNAIVQMLLALPCTVIIVTHDLFDSYMAKFNQIYCVSKGDIVERGSYTELITLNGEFSRIVKSMNKKD